jgi:hypothetical protein
MGIVAFCPHGHRINVKASLAGKKGLCPTCGAKFRIPAAAGGEPPSAARGLPTARLLEMASDIVATLPRVLSFDAVQPAAEPVFQPPPQPLAPPPPALHPVLAERPDLEWCIAIPGGEPTEPLSADSMQAWLESGQVAGNEVVWRSDWPEWRPARDVFR